MKQFLLNSNIGEVRWETKNVMPGIYFYQLMNGKKIIGTGKVAIMK